MYHHCYNLKMELSFFYKLKAWQLNLISVLLIVISFISIEHNVTINFFRIGLIIWFIYNQLFISTIATSLKLKIPEGIHYAYKIYYSAILLNTILFSSFVFLALGPDRFLSSMIHLFIFVILIGLVGFYTFLFTTRVLLTVEKQKMVSRSDAFMEYLEFGFTILSIYALQKRAKKLL